MIITEGQKITKPHQTKDAKEKTNQQLSQI
jgi:hypothetical protein